jgi:predicted ATPase with chaperone activity
MNNTENKKEIKIEQSTDSDIKGAMKFDHQLTKPGKREEMPSLKSSQTPGIDFCEIKGQYLAKRALEIAAAGSHHTMLIKAFPSIQPDKRIRNH